MRFVRQGRQVHLDSMTHEGKTDGGDPSTTGKGFICFCRNHVCQGLKKIAAIREGADGGDDVSGCVVIANRWPEWLFDRFLAVDGVMDGVGRHNSVVGRQGPRFHGTGCFLTGFPCGRLAQTVLVVDDAELSDAHKMTIGVVFVEDDETVIEVFDATAGLCSGVERCLFHP